jgi:hypothetical protein
MRQEIRVKEAEMGNIELKNQQIEEKKTLLNSQKNLITGVEKEISDIQKIKIEKQTQIEELSKKMNEKNRLENEKDKSELTLNNKKDSLNTYDREIKLLQQQIKGTENLSFSEKDIEITKNRIKTQEQMLKELNEEYIRAITMLQSNELKMKDLKTISTKISALDKCTTCLQIVNDEHKHNIVLKATQELRSIEAETMLLKKNKQETSEKLEATKKLVESLKQSLSQLEILKIKLESQICMLSNKNVSRSFGS